MIQKYLFISKVLSFKLWMFNLAAVPWAWDLQHQWAQNSWQFTFILQYWCRCLDTITRKSWSSVLGFENMLIGIDALEFIAWETRCKWCSEEVTKSNTSTPVRKKDPTRYTKYRRQNSLWSILQRYREKQASLQTSPFFGSSFPHGMQIKIPNTTRCQNLACCCPRPTKTARIE